MSIDTRLITNMRKKRFGISGQMLFLNLGVEQQITPLQVFIVFYFLCCTFLEKHIPVNWEQILTYYWSVVALRRRIVNSSHTICHHPSYNAKREVERSGRGTSRSLMKSNDTVAVWVIETL